MITTCRGMLVLGICFAILSSAFGHDLFLKPDKFFFKPGEKVSISLMNGTFQKSEGAVAFARLTDVSIVTASGLRVNPIETDFTKNETTAFVNVTAAEEGTYVAGLSTLWRENQLAAKEFNEYLVLEGIPDVLENRKRDKELDIDGRYRYSKYVKTIFQTGDKRTDSYKTVLGYAVEMVPRQNPYKLKAGDFIEIMCFKDGRPLIDQTIMVGNESNEKLAKESKFVSDSKGLIKVKLDKPGKWYAKLINMVKISEAKLNYESKWATLTFEIKK